MKLTFKQRDLLSVWMWGMPGLYSIHINLETLAPILQAAAKATPGSNWSKSDRLESYLGITDFRDIKYIVSGLLEFIKNHQKVTGKKTIYEEQRKAS